MNPVDLFTLIVSALAMELDEMERNGVDAERLARAEQYVAWIKARGAE